MEITIIIKEVTTIIEEITISQIYIFIINL